MPSQPAEEKIASTHQPQRGSEVMASSLENFSGPGQFIMNMREKREKRCEKRFVHDEDRLIQAE